jgi:predicted esterase
MHSTVKKILLLIILLQALTSRSLLIPQVPSNDRVTDTVKCSNSPAQSYTLYLPVQYDNKKSWPVIFIFDPGARGRTGVNAFVESGRKYGFILACSNNSHNGQLADNFTAAAAMLKDVEARFNVDQRRIYSAGFSGGSRFAMALAITDKKIAGVIGCGAGLPNDRNLLPNGLSDFVYYGLAGYRDMNYLEMNELPVFLNNRTKVKSFLRTFSGGHQWPGEELLTEAVEWILLQEMNKKLIPADQTFITNLEKKAESLINAQLSAGNITEASRYMGTVMRDFPGTPFAARIGQKLKDSENSGEYKSAIRRWTKMAATEKETEEKYLNYLDQILGSGLVPDSASTWFNTEIKALVRLRDKGSDENSQMASRVMNFTSILCSEQGTSLYRSKNYGQAVLMFGICTMSDSENPNNYYNLARSLAQSGKAKKSIDALSGAVSHGFSSRKAVESDPAFGMLRGDPKYKEIIMKLK